MSSVLDQSLETLVDSERGNADDLGCPAQQRVTAVRAVRGWRGAREAASSDVCGSKVSMFVHAASGTDMKLTHRLICGDFFGRH